MKIDLVLLVISFNYLSFNLFAGAHKYELAEAEILIDGALRNISFGKYRAVLYL